MKESKLHWNIIQHTEGKKLIWYGQTNEQAYMEKHCNRLEPYQKNKTKTSKWFWRNGRGKEKLNLEDGEYVRIYFL